MNQLRHKQKNTIKGQAVVEALISLPMIFTCLMLCLLFFYVHIQHTWADHHLYQALICMAQGQAKEKCKNQLIKNTKVFMRLGRLKNIQLRKSLMFSQWKGRLTYEGLFWKMDLTKQLNLNKRGSL